MIGFHSNFSVFCFFFVFCCLGCKNVVIMVVVIVREKEGFHQRKREFIRGWNIHREPPQTLWSGAKHEAKCGTREEGCSKTNFIGRN